MSVVTRWVVYASMAYQARSLGLPQTRDPALTVLALRVLLVALLVNVVAGCTAAQAPALGVRWWSSKQSGHASNFLI